MKHCSLVNDIYSNMSNQPSPELGMDATVCHYSDRDAGKITEIFNKGSFEYIIVTSTGYGAGGTFRRKVGSDERWTSSYYNSVTGRWCKSNNCSVIIGISDSYYDPHF